MLPAGTVANGWWPMNDAPRIDLVDFGTAEAAAAIVGKAGTLPINVLRKAAHFTGGVPRLVDAVSARVSVRRFTA